jgi:ATP-binding protein involved in chromosome partitioning
MKPAPKSIKATEGNLTIVWNDGHESIYSGRSLRLACRCAACVDEWTHESLVQPDQIPAIVKPEKIEVVGNYALHFIWSDGHSTGIYSYDSLREQCECKLCRPVKA